MIEAAKAKDEAQERALEAAEAERIRIDEELASERTTVAQQREAHAAEVERRAAAEADSAKLSAEAGGACWRSGEGLIGRREAPVGCGRGLRGEDRLHEPVELVWSWPAR